jgi:hypothetical protein
MAWKSIASLPTRVASRLRDSVGWTVGLKQADPADPKLVGPGMSWVARHGAETTTRSIVFENTPHKVDAATWTRVAPGLSWRRIVQEDADAVHVTRSVQVDIRALGVVAAVLVGGTVAVCRRSSG